MPSSALDSFASDTQSSQPAGNDAHPPSPAVLHILSELKNHDMHAKTHGIIQVPMQDSHDASPQLQATTDWNISQNSNRDSHAELVRRIKAIDGLSAPLLLPMPHQGQLWSRGLFASEAAGHTYLDGAGRAALPDSVLDAGSQSLSMLSTPWNVPVRSVSHIRLFTRRTKTNLP
jgi:hypothetical protein